MKHKRIIRFIFTSLIVASAGYAGESRLELGMHFSPSLGINKNFYIYLPEGYDDHPEEHYPVVYFFRGHESEWTDLNEDDSRQERNIKTLADQLYAEGKIGRMILVMPGTMIHEGGFITYGINLNYPEFVVDSAGLGTGLYEDYFIDDLITHIDTTYRTIPSGTQRGTDGFSAGGWPALMSAVKHPHMFTSVGAYDGYLTYPLDLNNPFVPGILDSDVMLYRSYNPWYGPVPRDPEEIMLDSPANLIVDADDFHLSHLMRMRFMLHTVSEGNDIGIRWMTPYIDSLLETRGMDNQFEQLELTAAAAHNWYHADEHVLITLPLHWNRFQNPVDILDIRLSHPSDREELSDNIMLSWSPGVLLQSGRTEILYSIDGGRTDYPLATIESADSIYIWSTSELPDGTRYKLRLNVQGRAAATGDSVMGVVYTSGQFTINNPGNGRPEISFFSPVEAEQISANYLVQWEAADADGDSLTYTLEYSSDNGDHWQLLKNDIHEPSYLWQSENFENSVYYRMVVHASDGMAIGSDTSDIFTVYNERVPAEDKRVTQISGSGTPQIGLYIIDPGSLVSNAFYRITFDDTSSTKKVFHVINTNSQDTVLKAGDQLDGLRESELFEGLRLLIKDYSAAQINEPATGWKFTNSNLDITLFLPTIKLGDVIYEGIPYPADFSIRITDEITDSTTAAFGIPAKGVYFNVRNLSDSENADFIFQDINKDQRIGDNDIIYLMMKNNNGEFDLIWAVSFDGPSNPIPPAAGDELAITTFKPVTSKDIFEFEVINSLGEIDSQLPLAYQLYQNYPNPFNPVTKIKFDLADSGPVSIVVYNILGEKVTTLLNKRMNAGSHVIRFNGSLLPSGLYFYRIQAVGFSAVRKMILLK